MSSTDTVVAIIRDKIMENEVDDILSYLADDELIDLRDSVAVELIRRSSKRGEA